MKHLTWSKSTPFEQYQEILSRVQMHIECIETGTLREFNATNYIQELKDIQKFLDSNPFNWEQSEASNE